MSAADCTESIKVGADDTAHAETFLPLLPDEMFTFLTNTERLFRLNPLLTINEWLPSVHGFRCVGRNESNDSTFDLAIRVETDARHRRIRMHYATGIKRSTCIDVQAAATGTRLIVAEHYPRIEDPLDPRIAEVDRSLIPWVAAMRRHLLARHRWNWLPGWAWWSERFILSMPPRQRRIVRLLCWTTVLEFAVFLVLVAALRFAA